MILYIVIGVVIVALAVLLILYFRNKKKQRQAAAGAMEADAPGGGEIAVLIHEAEGKLAAAKVPGARVANLPVYLVLGEAGTTKTSVVLHSGLEPELVAGQVYQGGNVAPTRTANFWFSRRSLFVEAGGALLADPERWRTLVKRLQPRAAVVRKGEQAGRAAVVCFDCENFTKQGSMDIAVNAARILRAKLGEISQAMGINLPVYVVFTKVDRLPYFTEFVRNLNNEEATQVLGVTLPMLNRRSEGVYAEEETARLTSQFERLFLSLADARPEFLARELDQTKLPPAYEFAREFRKIRPVLVQFLVDLCRPSQLTAGPFLRGFYFAGVRPIVVTDSGPGVAEPAPAQQQYGGPAGATVMFQMRPDALSPALQPPPRPAPASRKVPQWLFLSHLFNDVLLADRAAMGASGASTRTSKGRRILFLLAATLCFLLTVAFTISFFNNHGIESRAWGAAKAIPAAEVPSTEFAPAPSLHRLEDLRTELSTLMEWERTGHPFWYKWELYIGDEVYRKARPVYCTDFRQLLLKQTQDNMVAFLRMAPSTNAEYRSTYEALRAYLMTTSHPEKSDSQLAPVLMRFWLNTRTADTERQTLARSQFDFYQRDLLVDPPCAASADAVTLAGARQYLKRLGTTRRVYQAMLDEANRKFQPVNFNRTYSGSERTVVDNYDVPGAFTAPGWQFMTDAIAHPDRYVKGEAWVLGEDSTASIDLAKLPAEIKPLYVADFLKEWRSYIAAGRVQRYTDWNDAASKLDILDSNSSTLLELFLLVSKNTAVDDDTVKRVFQPVQSVVPPGSQDHMIAGPNQPYMGALSQLQLAALPLAKQPGDSAAASAGQGTATQARGAAKSLSQGFTPDSEGHVDREVYRLLEEPIKWAEVLFPNDRDKLNKQGQAMCRVIYPLLEKYPFSGKKNAPKATLAEIDGNFKPNGGQLWEFVRDNFKNELKAQGLHFEPSGAGPPINPDFVAWLNKVGRFAEAAYKGGSNTARLAYSVKPVAAPEIEGITLNIDGDAANFASNPAPHQFTWPGNTQGVNLTVIFRGGQKRPFPSYEGLWGVFEWVTDADKRPTPTAFEIIEGAGIPKRYTINPDTGQPFAVKFEINADPPVFNPGYFAFSCVPRVAK